MLYDALGRAVEVGVNGNYTEIMYTPVGKAAILNDTTVQSAFFPLPGGGTLYETGSSGSNQYLWHKDWLGSVRLASTVSSRSVYFDRGFAPFGETYDNFGNTAENTFAGDAQDLFTGLFDTPNRELSSSEGRWLSPDPAGLSAVDPSNPQTWNRYAYVVNNPLSFVDPTGLDCAYLNDSGTGVDENGIDHNSNQGECWSNGGYWADGYIGGNSWVQTFSNSDNVIIDSSVNGFLGQTLAGSLNNGGIAFSQMFGLNASVDTILSNPFTPTNYVDPMAPSARQMLRAIAAAAPTVCGGGVFGYAGAAGEVKSGALKGAEGFVGYLGEYDSNTGWSNNVLVEAGTHQASGGAVVNTQSFEPLVFLPVAPYGGLVGAPGGAGFYVGTPNFGVGAYVNVTTNAACQQIRGH
ncbi:MAG TPA: RHS repeat-associated core domain-containing protein [Candidatus Sulfotelmatobacter sp.]|nr:RHS repeat-associated core domain-containing protein [Candidatus Sulfotelmatobacter sp.]